MKIKILSISKNKFNYIDQAEADYKKRIGRSCELEIINLKEEPITKNKSKEQILKAEGESILAKLDKDYYNVILDVEGKEYSSESFASLILNNRDLKGGKICFVIGGPLGISGEVKARADLSISFSKMTFTHQLIRILLLEQIYRAFEIIKGTDYHK